MNLAEAATRAAGRKARRGTVVLPVRILPQPDETTCGPTCLHAIYGYWGDDEPLGQHRGAHVAHAGAGGTFAVFLGCDALRNGYHARIYTYNLTVFDPTWFTHAGVDIAERLAQQREVKADDRLQHATAGLSRIPAARRPPALRQPVAELHPRDSAAQAADPDRLELDLPLPHRAGIRHRRHRRRCARLSCRPLRRDRRLGSQRRRVLVVDPYQPNPVRRRRTNTGSASIGSSARSCSASSRTTPIC